MNATMEQQGPSLPGYTLSTRLGAGGYGEVWLAHAPGGLTKAVKFIFGSFHEKRAAHELRALQRMKDLRHPFLLSLERIEVVDGRLVIVTELAESSLKDRFDQCQREGLPGIPRDELLRYLGDAADALDFLSGKHSLQHLDVKPENLLLVAGHVKVADFGLVKDVGDPQASLVGGLTPLYSAPEVFQGNPSVHSDQYSLAVLFQEMLTGRLPFPGATAAELTMQHLHDEPDLSPLPVADRFILARALSKDPAQRFDSCRELIASLSTAEADRWTGSPADESPAVGFAEALPERRATPRAASVTEFFDEPAADGPRTISKSMLLDWQLPPAAPARRLPAVAPVDEEFAAEPTLVIGIGGLGAAVLRNFRSRVTRHFGDAPVPAVQLLLLDSDPKSIAAATHGDARSALKAEETLSLPLRRPQDYRENSGQLMRWLSRRWLYNIPKSLRTEGLRPLGRLALAGHARQTAQRIRMALAQATSTTSVEQSSEIGRMPFRGGSARVYLVASINGGTGSGMSIDVGYATRAALDKAGLTDAQIIGVFLHSAGRDPRHCDLARVNAHAWLTEYNHFHREPAQFPGDESCGLPAMPVGRRAFDSAYLLDLNAEADHDEFETATQGVADYLFLDALTAGRRFFQTCRRETPTGPIASAPLRTFRLQRISAASEDSIEAASALVSREVVAHWSGGADAPADRRQAASATRDTDQVVKGAATLVVHLQLKLEGLASNARNLIDSQFGGDQQEFIASLLAPAQPGSRPQSASEQVQLVDSLFATAQGQQILQRPLESIVSPLTMKLAGDISRWVLQKLDDRQERLDGSKRAAQWLVDHLMRVEGDASRLGGALGRQIAAQAAELRRLTAAGPEINDRVATYFRMRVDQQAVLAAALISRRLLAELKSISSTMTEFGRHVKNLAGNMPVDGIDIEAPRDPLGHAVVRGLAELADAVDARLQVDFIERHGGLFQTIMGNSRLRSQLLQTLAALSRQSVEALASRADFAASNAPAPSSHNPAFEPPALLAHGGAYRSLVALPAQDPGHAAGRLPGDLEQNEVTVVSTSGRDMILCCEAWDLPLVNIAAELIDMRRDYAEFAARVATRNDVPWTPLMAPACVPPILDFASVAAPPALATQVL